MMSRALPSICWCANSATDAAPSIRSCGAIEARLMEKSLTSILRRFPSVDQVMQSARMVQAVDRFGRPAAVDAVRRAIAQARALGGARGGIDDFAQAALPF